ncbi:MAG: flagellar basal body-associated protein FliL [Burkholderiaceae bacterium]|nr:flagellar basal body-associated protein FliL [Burkholderiaceae bacterium]
MAKNKPNKASQALKGLIAVISIIAASVAGTMYYQNQMDQGFANASSSTAPAVVLPNPVFSPLEPFTVTLNDHSGGRVLYVAITLRVANDAAHKMIQEYMPEVRDRVLRELASQQPDQVQTLTGREALVHSLTQVLQEPYLPHSTGPQITSVLFTAFVVQ